RIGAPVGDGPEAAPPPSGTVGDYVGLCLLVDFRDFPATIDRDEVDAFCNEPGYRGFGNNGSAYDYFLEVSAGKLRYRNVVTAYYRARRDRSYYTNETVPYPQRAQELIGEALAHLKATGFDFSPLTTDDQGFVYATSVFYAGKRSNNWSKGLWPHSWRLDAPFQAAPGITISDYQITDIGDRLTLRTFCHENGHMVCDFPDLYDYGYESKGIGNYCLMCSGASDTNPAHVSAYLKYKAGWSNNVTSIAPASTATVKAGTNDFLIHRKNAREYFILENRQRAGRDAALPDGGLAIWHVDEAATNNDEQMTTAHHYECSLEQADNRFDLEHGVNFGDAGDLFDATVGKFGKATRPSSRWWDGSPSALEIVAVSASGPTMTVTTAATASPGLRGQRDLFGPGGAGGDE
ncbi:MAG TPA: M6 family metalloprotease domain-containing protein, partial [Nocardioides sp.]|nr:M6 family metalloprotease domain-containing protein [Nocardioides sp.]